MSNSNKLLDLIEEYLKDITKNLSDDEIRKLYLNLAESLKEIKDLCRQIFDKVDSLEKRKADK